MLVSSTKLTRVKTLSTVNYIAIYVRKNMNSVAHQRIGFSQLKAILQSYTGCVMRLKITVSLAPTYNIRIYHLKGTVINCTVIVKQSLHTDSIFYPQQTSCFVFHLVSWLPLLLT
jgi:hypothetical protein